MKEFFKNIKYKFYLLKVLQQYGCLKIRDIFQFLFLTKHKMRSNVTNRITVVLEKVFTYQVKRSSSQIKRHSQKLEEELNSIDI